MQVFPTLPSPTITSLTGIGSSDIQYKLIIILLIYICYNSSSKSSGSPVLVCAVSYLHPKHPILIQINWWFFVLQHLVMRQSRILVVHFLATSIVAPKLLHLLFLTLADDSLDLMSPDGFDFLNISPLTITFAGIWMQFSLGSNDTFEIFDLD